MSEKKKVDFGLPDIGGRSVAAALVGRRQADDPREEDDLTNAQGSMADTDLSKAERRQTFVAPLPTEATEATKPTKPIETPLTSPASVVPEQSSPELNRGGRPRKGSKKMHLAFAPPIAEYLELAWRTHRRPDGSLAAGPSSLIEDLLIEHRHRNRP